MGEPASVSPADRAAVRELARRIVDSVREDAAMPLDFTIFRTPHIGNVCSVSDVETLAFKLAAEIVELQSIVKGLLDMASVLASPVGGMPGAIQMAKTDIARIRKEMGMP